DAGVLPADVTRPMRDDEPGAPDDENVLDAAGVTNDAGVDVDSSAPTEAPDDFGVEGIIAVGYGGLRVVSRDSGQSWQDEIHWSENGGDDHDLLRTIAYGNGIWVSGGWRITTSADGVEWNDRGDAEDVIAAVNCQVTDGMAFGGGRFLVACGATLASSSNGLDWERVGPTPGVGGHPYIFFDDGNQQFACSGDDGASFVSKDGSEWDPIQIDSVRWCEDGLTPESDCPGYYA